ncbi:putative bifunctional diguanylate cyclase/phosphodiesterase [Holdemania massiliensis]|uniref:putative bifunctional diguanylate cyclase/phosphodiesterase n=1 Tax=Holdemania massiliensis TaxID=1468449 RepID=UPI0035667A99
MKTQIKRAVLLGGSALIVLLSGFGIFTGMRGMLKDIRQWEADNILYFYSENIKLQLHGSLNEADLLAQSALILGTEDPQWLDTAAASLMENPAVKQVYLFEGDTLVRALPQASEKVQEGKKLKDFSYAYTLAKVVKELVIEGPVVEMHHVPQSVFLFLQPFTQQGAYLGLVVVALDSDYVLEQFSFDYFQNAGYDYELWRVDQQTGRKEIVISSNAEMDFSQAAKTNFYLPTEWNLSIQPVDGWISPRQNMLVAAVTLAEMLLLGLLLAAFVQLQNKNRKLRKIAVHDPGTGLYNRTGFCQKLDLWLRQSSAPVQLFYLVFEGYDQTAQLMGPEQENTVLKGLYPRLNAYIQSPFLAGRLSAGNLVVAIRDEMDVQQREDFARGLSLELMLKVRIMETKKFLTAQVQHALCTLDPAQDQLEVLIRKYYLRSGNLSPIHSLTQKIQRLIQGQNGIVFDEDADLEILELSKALNQYRKKAEQMAYSDPAFKVGNRMKYQRDVNVLIQYDKRRRFRLYCIDICSFSQYNELFSADVGDKILREVILRLSRVFGSNLYRINGDVFLGIQQSSENQEQLSQQLHELLSRPVTTGKASLNLEVRIAVCSYPQHGSTPENLLDRVQAALRHAKQTNLPTVIYNSKLDQLLRTETEILHQLQARILDQTLQVWYQPLRDLPTKQYLAAEALVRLPDLKGGYYSAAQVVALAERSQMVEQLGDYVLVQACLYMKHQGKALGLQRMSVNLSVQQLLINGSAEHLLTLIKSCGIDLSLITLEITESVLIQSLEQASATLEQLRKAGIRIALDDFGVGYSSLNYLSNLPVDVIKIDRSLTKQILTSSKQYTLLKAIVEMAAVNHLSVVAEGIETEEEKRMIEELGVQYIQGYFYSKPKRAEELNEFLSEQNRKKFQ